MLEVALATVEALVALLSAVLDGQSIESLARRRHLSQNLYAMMSSIQRIEENSEKIIEGLQQVSAVSERDWRYNAILEGIHSATQDQESALNSLYGQIGILVQGGTSKSQFLRKTPLLDVAKVYGSWSLWMDGEVIESIEVQHVEVARVARSTLIAQRPSHEDNLQKSDHKRIANMPESISLKHDSTSKLSAQSVIDISDAFSRQQYIDAAQVRLTKFREAREDISGIIRKHFRPEDMI